jgi:hypothetical protein
MPEFKPRNSEVFPDNKRARPERINERTAFIFVGLIGIVALFLGFLRLTQYIKSPFLPEVSLSNTSVFLSQAQLEQIDALKNIDTDGDGLSDYDELYFYHTSPYLSDSDSDGISDKQEMEGGTDPNCPAGETCVSYGSNSNTTVNAEASDTNSSLLSGEVTAAALRETLKNAGVPQNILDGTSDADLLEVYNQTLQETQAGNTNASNTNTVSLANTNISLATDASANVNANNQEVADVLKSLTPAEIRQFLLENGLTESDLSGVDDATLQAIFLKALEEQSTTTNTNQ